MYLTALVLALAAAQAQPPIDVAGRKQLFIDNRFIAASDDVALTMNPPRKAGLAVDESGARIKGHIARVMERDGLIRLFVGADRVDEYASEDGLRFRRTGLTISGGVFTTPFFDEREPDPARRWKIFWIVLSTPPDPAVDGVYAAYSANGADLAPVGRVLPYYVDNPPLVFWDPRIAKYVVYTRALERDSENQRRIARIELDDPLAPWPYTPAADDGWWASPRNIPVVYQQNEAVEPYSDLYYNAADIYAYGQDVYLLFPSAFRHFAPARQPFIRPRTPGQWEDYGLLEVQCAVSRDGVAWTRPSAEPYVAPGLAGEWDRWYAVMAPGMVRRGDYLFQYYYSSGMTHDSVVVRPEYDNIETELGGIGLVQQRLDGFVSAETDERGGWIETPPIVFEGARLRLNVDTGAMGTVFVEIREPGGKAIEGFERAACEETGGNYIDQTVYWNGSADLSALAGKPVVLRFDMIRAKLFAFQFTAE